MLWAWLSGGCAVATTAHEPSIDPPEAAPNEDPCRGLPSDVVETTLPVWDLRIATLHWDLLHDDVRAHVEVPAAVCIEGERYPVALELQGSSTRTLDKKSFDLKWKRGKLLDRWPYTDPPLGADADAQPSIRKLLLKAMARDQSLVREAVSFELYRALGYETPRSGFVNLRINGAYWGLYSVVEPVNDAYLASHGYPSPGRLYKAVRKHGSRGDFSPGRDLTRAFETDPDDVDWDNTPDAPDLPDRNEQGRPDESDRHEAPEPEALPEPGEPEQDPADLQPSAAMPEDVYADLARFLDLLQDTPLSVSAFETAIDPVFPLANYIDRMVWVAFTQNGDAVAQNFFLYQTLRDAGERWYQLPWDSDISLGADWRDSEAIVGADDVLLLDGGNYYSRRLLNVPALRSRYVARFREVLDAQQLPAAGMTRLEEYRRLLAHDLALDQARWRRALEPHPPVDPHPAFLSAPRPSQPAAL
ncbi:MAG: CotH kinase family protein, partial [Polyangiales bacterium]